MEWKSGRTPQTGAALGRAAELQLITLATMSQLIQTEDLTRWIKKAPEWEYEDNCLARTVEFDEFTAAIDFVNDVAEIAEEAHHHPDIDIRWCKVTLRLTTHDQGGVTDLDFEMASRIDTLVD